MPFLLISAAAADNDAAKCSAKRVAFRSVGEPDWVVTMALWTPQEWTQFRAAVARDAGAEAGRKLDEGLAELRKSLGLGIEDVLGAIGPELSFVQDGAGMYGAVRLADYLVASGLHQDRPVLPSREINGSLDIGESGQLLYQAYAVNGAILDFSIEKAVESEIGEPAILKLASEISLVRGPVNGEGGTRAGTWRVAYSPKLGAEIGFSGYQGRYTPEFMDPRHERINALGVDGTRGRLGIAVVALHQILRPDHDLPRGAARLVLAGVGIDHAHLEAFARGAGGFARLFLGRVEERDEQAYVETGELRALLRA